MSSCDYKGGCGSCPAGTRLIFHAVRYLLQTIRALQLFLLMWKMWGCFIYEKERKGPIRQVADVAIKDIWRLWWRFESCIGELVDPERQTGCALENGRCFYVTVLIPFQCCRVGWGADGESLRHDFHIRMLWKKSHNGHMKIHKDIQLFVEHEIM